MLLMALTPAATMRAAERMAKVARNRRPPLYPWMKPEERAEALAPAEKETEDGPRD